MTSASPVSAQEPIWQRRRVQGLAVALLVLLAGLYNYLEQMPLSRTIGAEELVQTSPGMPVELSGLQFGDVMTFRLVNARRLLVAVPGGAEMTVPDKTAFLAKAKRQAVEFTGSDYGNRIVVDAHKSGNDIVSMNVSLMADGSNENRHRSLFIEKANPAKYQNGLRIWSKGSRLKINIELGSDMPTPSRSAMILSYKGSVATVGHAEFVLPADQPFVGEFRDAPVGAAGDEAVAVDLPGADSSLRATSVATGPLVDEWTIEPEKIICASGSRSRLWWRVLPRVTTADCGPETVSVSALSVPGGQLTVNGRAFLKGFSAKDAAHYVSSMTTNTVLQTLFATLLTGFVTWAVALFRRNRAQRVSDKPVPRKRRRN